MESLSGKRVAFTGRLASMKRAQAEELVRNCGGQVTPHVLPNTHLLVIGQRGLPIEETGRLSANLRKAQAVRDAGANLEVLPEEQWLVRFSPRAKKEVDRLLSADEVCDMLAISREQLRAWVRFGLIHPDTSQGQSQFNFTQVASAKKLVELAHAGVTTSKIRRSLQRLRSWLPSADAPLAQLGIIERNGTLLIRMEQGQLADPEGQMHLEFTPEGPASLKLDGGARSAEWWFSRGCEQEEAGDLKDAASSYRQALLAGGPSAELCFNLANVLYALGQRAQASERYRQAVEIDPEFIEAWNNLGIVLAEMKQCDDALWAYRKALELDPNYADAHYNLADCLDRNGCTTDARTHWEQYVRLDPASEWTAYVQGRLQEKKSARDAHPRSRS